MEKEQELIEKTKALLERMAIKNDGVRYVGIRENQTTKDGSIKDVFVMSYGYHAEHQYISNYVFIDAKTEEFLYIMTKHGYIEIE